MPGKNPRSKLTGCQTCNAAELRGYLTLAASAKWMLHFFTNEKDAANHSFGDFAASFSQKSLYLSLCRRWDLNPHEVTLVRF